MIAEREANPCYNIVTMAEKKNPSEGSEFWQIIFPTLVGTLLMLVLGIWFGLTGSTGSLSRFAQISTAMLAIPVFFAALLFGLVMVGLIYLVDKLMKGIPTITGRVFEVLDKIQEGAVKGSRSLARLVIEPTSLFAIFRCKVDQQDQEIKLKD